METKYQVHLIDTDKASEIYNKFNGATKAPLIYTPNNALASVNYWAKHLYITSNEEIKDWGYVLVNGTHIRQVQSVMSSQYLVIGTNNAVLKEVCKKIVATTNPELQEIVKVEGGFTGSLRPVAKIDQQFIELYIKRYNEGNPIKKVKLEVEDSYFNNQTDGKIKVDRQSAVIPIIEEEKMYSREELLKISYESYRHGVLAAAGSYRNTTEVPSKSFIEQFNKTYPNT